MDLSVEALWHSLRTDVLGLHRSDDVRGEGGAATRRRIYLDTTATALMPALVWRGLEAYLEHAAANSHTGAHRAGRSTTEALEESRLAVARLVGAVEGEHVALFAGSGATGAINFLARALFPPELRLPVRRVAGAPPEALVEAMRQVFPQGRHALEAILERPLVVSTIMEHHSNILPWVEAVGRHNTRFIGVRPDGRLDMDELRAVMAAEGRRVRLVAVSGASNVTGIVNPIHEIAALAHRHGAQILVDAAQLAPHRRIDMSDIDFLVISGHKLYAPGSRGVLVGRLGVLGACRCVGDLGGGMVEYVSLDDYRVKEEVTAREEAGTPNIPGTIGLGIVAEALMRVGMDRVEREEEELVGYALERLRGVPGLTLYGTTDPSARVGVFAVNLGRLHHGLVAAFLDDHYAVAVRDGCFCAHPYVKALLGVDEATEQRLLGELEVGDRRHVPGMVRLSLGLYSTREDVDVVVEALGDLWRRRDAVVRDYEARRDGEYRPREGLLPGEDRLFLPSRWVRSAQDVGSA